MFVRGLAALWSRSHVYFQVVFVIRNDPRWFGSATPVHRVNEDRPGGGYRRQYSGNTFGAITCDEGQTNMFKFEHMWLTARKLNSQDVPICFPLQPGQNGHAANKARAAST